MRTRVEHMTEKRFFRFTAAWVLDRARNWFGPLDSASRGRIQKFLNQPTEENWDDCFSVVVTLGGKTGELPITLWQAWLAVDLEAPKEGPSTTFEGEVLSGWSRIPDPFTIYRALDTVLGEV